MVTQHLLGVMQRSMNTSAMMEATRKKDGEIEGDHDPVEESPDQKVGRRRIDGRSVSRNGDGRNERHRE